VDASCSLHDDSTDQKAKNGMSSGMNCQVVARAVLMSRQGEDDG
jgi:hypothetical protein